VAKVRTAQINIAKIAVRQVVQGVWEEFEKQKMKLPE
jgi:hypothetical protein